MTHTYSSDGTMVPTVDLYLPLQHYNDTYCLTNYSVFMPYIVTTNYSVLMIYNVTALSRPYDLYYNSTHYVSLLHLLQQLIRLHDLSCYRNKDTLRSTPTATITSLRPHIL